MDWIASFVKFLGDHPKESFGLVLVLTVVWFLLNRKNRLTREAEQRLKQLRKERGDQYNQLRPLH